MVTAPHQTAKERLITERLGGNVDIRQYVAERRDRRGWSWREISLAIRDETGVEVTDTTLRLWQNRWSTETAQSDTETQLADTA